MELSKLAAILLCLITSSRKAQDKTKTYLISRFTLFDFVSFDFLIEYLLLLVTRNGDIRVGLGWKFSAWK